MEATCTNCSIDFEHGSSSTGKYCSNACQRDYEWKQRKILILEGKGKHRAVKRYLLEQGHRCNKCKNSEWNGEPIPLDLEHIDGNSDNNNLNNVELLCCNCHAQTPTYKNKNKGNGRHERRRRYANGLSY